MARDQANSHWNLTYSTDSVLAFLALQSLILIQSFGSKAALLFLLSGAALTVRNIPAALVAMRREWMLVALGTWCVVSVLWSEHPSITLRHGIQLCLTFAVSIIIAYRIPPASFARILLAVTLIAALGSIASGRGGGGGGGYLGLFGSKNALAGASVILIIAALAVLFDRQMPRIWRWAAALGLGSGTLLLVMAKSTGAMAAVAFVLLIFGMLLTLRRLSPTARLTALTLMFLLLVMVGVLIWSMIDRISIALLEATGKDLTLTGRTDLWAVAIGEIIDRPWLGIGFQAFWVVGNPQAEFLWWFFYIESRSGFNFHNTLLNNAVELGLIGAGLQAVIFFGALGPLLAWALRQPNAASLLLTLFMMRQALMMWVEVEFFGQFSLASAVTVIAIGHAHQARRARKEALRRIPQRGRKQPVIPLSGMARKAPSTAGDHR